MVIADHFYVWSNWDKKSRLKLLLIYDQKSSFLRGFSLKFNQQNLCKIFAMSTSTKDNKN